MTQSTPRYLPRAKYLHWIMAALVMLAYTLILSRTQLERGSAARTFVVVSHYWAGIIVFILVWPRIAHRLRHAPPSITPPLSPLLTGLAHLTHGLLYGFLIAQPVLGVMTVLLEKGGIALPLSSWVLASPFAVNKDAAHFMQSIHVWLGIASYYVVGLHVLAALWHHFGRRDNTLQRMV